MPRSALALAGSTHPGPAVLVTTVSTLFALGLGVSGWRLAVVVVAVLANQLSIGLSNDWIDAERDRAVGRRDKPVARGDVSVGAVRVWAIGTLVASVVLACVLGAGAGIGISLLALGGWAYNLGLKRTLASVVPYLVGFGALPVGIGFAAEQPVWVPAWLPVATALLGAAAHFANVLPDLEDDAATGVRGLPHALGRRVSGLVGFALLAASAAVLTFGPAGAPSWPYVAGFVLSLGIAVAGATIALTRPPTRLLMRLVMFAALLDVLLIAFATDRLLA
ncbi:UbiA family prenyltransferase [Desertivibrio insolitus]|uniref:UbiA family prenyltransferase n=1 Tax=Herbiconiux sp. SYSU D00978 TaxID=2812562 RepID=UPI001A97ADE6|nr:UbiA family prenyltransferase [Herbiconiux sp. SYSU D00978]